MKSLLHSSREILIASAAVLGFGLGYVLHAALPASFPNVVCDEKYPLLNPYLRCEPEESLKKKEFTAFKRDLESFIQERVLRGKAQTVSVYFRDLENGPWFGIGEQELFSPASMMKLPLLVALYRKAESSPEILEQQIEAGSTTSTISDLMNQMIIESDNAPLPILFSFLQQFYPEEDIFAETITAMGLAASEGSEDDFLTVKRYASIYRMLYNASFLHKDTSQSALDLLTKARSPVGIRDAVPAEIPVAHKFGIRTHDGSITQLHDCGIVYYPENHYLLCIMTKGGDEISLAVMIRDIAAMVHEEMEERSAMAE